MTNFLALASRWMAQKFRAYLVFTRNNRRAMIKHVLALSLVIFLAELAIGIYSKSILLLTDALHMLTDLVAYLLALLAIDKYELHAAAVNGAFTAGVAFMLILESVERVVEPKEVQKPLLVMIMGFIAIFCNLLSLALLMGHLHGPGHHHHHHDSEKCPDHLHGEKIPQHNDGHHNVKGILIHVMGDTLTNLVVIASGAIIWKVHSPHVHLSDSVPSILINIWLAAMGCRLTYLTLKMLFHPLDAKTKDLIVHDISAIDGVRSVHSFNEYRITESKIQVSLHYAVDFAALCELAQQVSFDDPALPRTPSSRSSRASTAPCEPALPSALPVSLPSPDAGSKLASGVELPREPPQSLANRSSNSLPTVVSAPDPSADNSSDFELVKITSENIHTVKCLIALRKVTWQIFCVLRGKYHIHRLTIQPCIADMEKIVTRQLFLSGARTSLDPTCLDNSANSAVSAEHGPVTQTLLCSTFIDQSMVDQEPHLQPLLPGQCNCCEVPSSAGLSAVFERDSRGFLDYLFKPPRIY